MTSSDDPLPPSKHKIELRNESQRTIKVLVEWIPEWYIIEPKDQLALLANVEDVPFDEGYTIRFCDDFVHIISCDVQPAVFINGRQANPDFIVPPASS